MRKPYILYIANYQYIAQQIKKQTQTESKPKRNQTITKTEPNVNLHARANGCRRIILPKIILWSRMSSRAYARHSLRSDDADNKIFFEDFFFWLTRHNLLRRKESSTFGRFALRRKRKKVPRKKKKRTFSSLTAWEAKPGSALSSACRLRSKKQSRA